MEEQVSASKGAVMICQQDAVYIPNQRGSCTFQ